MGLKSYIAINYDTVKFTLFHYETLNMAYKIKDFPKHDHNPFTASGVKEVYRKVEGDQWTLANQVTGETTDAGGVRMIAKSLDTHKFIKVYTDRIQELLGMSAVEVNFFIYLCKHLVPSKGYIWISYEEAAEWCGYKSTSSINAGIAGMLNRGVLARSKYPGQFFVNIDFLYNGNRTK